MFPILALPAAVFSTLIFAQSDSFKLDTVIESKVLTDVENFATTVQKDPAFQTDVAAILSAVPASVLAQAESNPEALLEQLQDQSDLPSWVSAIPTSVIDSLETLAAKPIDAVEDVTKYIEELAAEPGVSSVLSVLETAVPSSVQDALASDPIAFLQNLVTATALPTWVAAIPAPVQSEIGSVINEGFSIIAADLEGSTLTSKPKLATPTVPGVSGKLPTVVSAKATGSGGVAVNGTRATGTPVAPFQGGAAPMRTAVGGAAALVAAAAGFWFVA